MQLASICDVHIINRIGYEGIDVPEAFRKRLRARASGSSYIFTSQQIAHLSYHGQDNLHGISKGTFEIPYKISYLCKIRFLYNVENLRANRLTSSYAFLKRLIYHIDEK